MIAIFVGLALAGDGDAPDAVAPTEIPTLVAASPDNVGVEPGVSEILEAPPAPPPARIEALLAEPEPAPKRAARTLDLDEGIPWAFLGVGGLAVAAMGWMKFRKPSGVTPRSPLAVVERVSVGGKAELLLIDVVTADGERRRLLIGTGGAAPALVADLGGREPAMEEPIPDAEPEAPVAPDRMDRIRRFVDTGGSTSTPRAAAERAPEPPRRVPDRAPERAPVVPQRSPAEAKSLVDEVLARRRGVR